MAIRRSTSSNRFQEQAHHLFTKVVVNTSHGEPNYPASQPFELVFVCSGNICRSVYAEHCLRNLISGSQLGSHIHVSSAGIRAVPGSPVDPQTAELFRQRFGAAISHRAREADYDCLSGEHLILSMTLEQRQWLVHRFPDLAPRVFALKEFVHVASICLESGQGSLPARRADPVTVGLETLVAVASANRDVGSDAVPDVPDPHGRAFGVHTAIIDELDAVIRELVAVFWSV